MRHLILKITTAALLAASLAAVAAAQSQFTSELPSQRLGRGFFVGATSARQFTGSSGGAPTGPLAVQFGVNPSRLGTTFTPTRFNFTDLRRDLSGLRLRTLESRALGQRARFAHLQRLSIELSGLIGGEALTGPADVKQAYFGFIFPFGLRDKTAELGYGYWSLGCLARGLIPDPEALLSEFSQEAQETIAEETFMKALASMVTAGTPGEGLTLDGFYDSQLAAMGNYLFAARRYSSAASVWQILARRDPQSSLYAMAAGQSLFAARQFAEASRELRRSFPLAAGWGTESFRIAGANLQNIYDRPDDLGDARENLEAMLTAAPDDKELKFLMAVIDLHHGLWPRAEAELKSLAAGGDEVAAALAGLLASGRVAESVRRPFASQTTLSAADVAELSRDVLLTRQERKAMVDAMLDPKSYEDYMNLGDFHFFMGNYARAAQAYSQAASLEPDKPIVQFAEAHAAFANGEFGYASRRLYQGLNAEPNLGLYNFRIEEFFGDRADMEKRLVDLEHLTRLEPDNLAARFLLGYVYYFDGRYGEAAEMLGQVVKASPDYQVADNLLKLARLQS